MRSLSSSCASASSDAGTPTNLKPSLSSPAASASSPPSLSSSASSLSQHQQRLTASDSEARDDLKAAFCVFDLDGDGYITQEEVRAGLKLLGESWSPAELRRLFSKCSNSQPNDLSAQQQRISIDDFVHLLL